MCVCVCACLCMCVSFIYTVGDRQYLPLMLVNAGDSDLNHQNVKSW